MPRHDPISEHDVLGSEIEEVEDFYDPPETIEGCLQELAAFRAKLLAMSNEELMRECQNVTFGTSYVDQLRLFAAEARGLRPPEPKAEIVDPRQYGLFGVIDEGDTHYIQLQADEIAAEFPGKSWIEHAEEMERKPESYEEGAAMPLSIADEFRRRARLNLPWPSAGGRTDESLH